MQNKILIDEPYDLAVLKKMQSSTTARICIGRAGTGYKTQTYLRYLADHAAAKDSIWAQVSEELPARLHCISVQSKAADKAEYIKRPDLGRGFHDETLAFISEHCMHHADVQIVIGDGLSAYAIEENAQDVYYVLKYGLEEKGYVIGTPVFVRYARVATMDKVSECLTPKVTVILIGERPGLITNKSMSAYIAYEARTDKGESQRTVVSNIYSGGTPAVEAGAQIVSMIDLMIQKKMSGTDLKL